MNVAFVGCGGMAAQYLSVYRDLDWVRPLWCIDVDREAAAKAAAVLGCPASVDYADALAPDIDTVVINSPNHLHAPQAIAAIEAGKNVLLQKPVAAKLEDAEAIARAAAKSTRTLGLYMSYFDQPLMYDLRDMVSQRHLGDVVQCYARLMHRGGMMWSRESLAGKPTWRGSLAETGGGCFIQLAVHYIHIFEWVTGQRVKRAAGFTGNLHCPGIEGEDLASAVLQMDSGAMVTLDTAWCANGEELAIHGTGGRVEYRYNRWLAVSSASGPFDGRVVHYTGGVVDAFGGPGDAANPLNQHRLFLEAARDGKPAPVPIESGVHDMRVVAAVYQSARSGRAVEMA